MRVDSRQRMLLQDRGVPRRSSRSLPGCLESAEQACCPETRDSLHDQAKYIRIPFGLFLKEFDCVNSTPSSELASEREVM